MFSSFIAQFLARVCYTFFVAISTLNLYSKSLQASCRPPTAVALNRALMTCQLPIGHGDPVLLQPSGPLPVAHSLLKLPFASTECTLPCFSAPRPAPSCTCGWVHPRALFSHSHTLLCNLTDSPTASRTSRKSSISNLGFRPYSRPMGTASFPDVQEAPLFQHLPQVTVTIALSVQPPKPHASLLSPFPVTVTALAQTPFIPPGFTAPTH